MHRSHTLALVVASLLIALPCCKNVNQKRFERKADKAWQRSLERGFEINLPELPLATRRVIIGGTRIMISPTTVSLDNAELIQEWWSLWLRHDPEALREFTIKDALVEEPGIASIKGGKLDPPPGTDGFNIHPLAIALERIFESSNNAFSARTIEHGIILKAGAVDLYIDADAPSGVVGRVVHTLGEAGYTRAGIAFDDSKTLELHGLTFYQGGRPDPNIMSDCVIPIVQASDEGWHVWAGHGRAVRDLGSVAIKGGGKATPIMISAVSHLRVLDGAAADMLDGPGVLPAYRTTHKHSKLVSLPGHRSKKGDGAWHWKLVLGEGDSCPAVPRMDHEALLNLLVDMEGIAPLCPIAYFSSLDHLPWVDAATIMGALSYNASIDLVHFVGSIDEKHATCSSGIRPENVSYEAFVPLSLAPPPELVALFEATRKTPPCEGEVCPEKALTCTCHPSGNLATVKFDTDKDGAFNDMDLYDDETVKFGEAMWPFNDKTREFGHIELFSHDADGNIVQQFVNRGADSLWDERATYTCNEEGERLTVIWEKLRNGRIVTSCFDFAPPCPPPFKECNQVPSKSGFQCQTPDAGGV